MTGQRASDAELDPNRSQNLVEESLFRFLVHLEVQKALRLRYPISVVCMTPDIPPEQIDPSFTRRVADLAIRRVRATDVITTLSQSSIGLLLIDAETWALSRIHQRLKEELEAHRLTVRGRESRLTWSAGGGCYPWSAPHLDCTPRGRKMQRGGPWATFPGRPMGDGSLTLTLNRRPSSAS